MTESRPSEYIYINKDLPTTFSPPRIVHSEVLDLDQIRELIRLNDPTTPENDGVEDPAAAILRLFSESDVLLGPDEFTAGDRERWLPMLRSFIERNVPIQFVAMAFPYKMPNPIKTGERLAPDAGEALMLRRFQTILTAIQRHYEPGARLTILEEGILGRCQGVDPREVRAYRDGIDSVRAASGINESEIDFHSLDDMIERVPNFEARWYFEQERLRGLWEAGDVAMREAHDAVYPGQRSSVPVREYDGEVLVRAYDPQQKGSELRYAREWFDAIAHRQFFAYRALLNVRDASGFLEEIRPRALKLTVSPKRGNLGVIPVNGWTHILPYHGAPVLQEDGRWTIDYYGSLGARGEMTAMHVEGDADAAPFAYREMS